MLERDPAPLLTVLQELYDSEINFALSTFWDGGFDWRLGDVFNGFKAAGYADTLVAACAELRDAAKSCFPDSDFAKRYRDGDSADARA